MTDSEGHEDKVHEFIYTFSRCVEDVILILTTWWPLPTDKDHKYYSSHVAAYLVSLTRK